MRESVLPFGPSTSREQALSLLQSLRALRNSPAHAHPLWAGQERYRPVTQCTSEDNAPLNYIKSWHDDVFALIRSINQDIANLLERHGVFEQLLHTDLKEFSVFVTELSNGNGTRCILLTWTCRHCRFVQKPARKARQNAGALWIRSPGPTNCRSHTLY